MPCSGDGGWEDLYEVLLLNVLLALESRMVVQEEIKLLGGELVLQIESTQALVFEVFSCARLRASWEYAEHQLDVNREPAQLRGDSHDYVLFPLVIVNRLMHILYVPLGL